MSLSQSVLLANAHMEHLEESVLKGPTLALGLSWDSQVRCWLEKYITISVKTSVVLANPHMEHPVSSLKKYSTSKLTGVQNFSSSFLNIGPIGLWRFIACGLVNTVDLILPSLNVRWLVGWLWTKHHILLEPRCYFNSDPPLMELSPCPNRTPPWAARAKVRRRYFPPTGFECSLNVWIVTKPYLQRQNCVKSALPNLKFFLHCLKWRHVNLFWRKFQTSISYTLLNIFW